MKVTLLVCAFVATFVAISANVDEFDRMWELYKARFDKRYTGNMEAMRRRIWEDNLKKIHLHNMEYDLGIHTHTLGLNAYADLTIEEFKALFYPPGIPIVHRNNSLHKAPAGAPMATSVDWRTKGYVTPVKNQGQCGSCWAFSTTGSLEGQHFRKTGRLVSLSEQQLVDCSKQNNGCGGGLMDYAFAYIKKAGGIMSEQSYRYTARDGTCKFDRAQVKATLTGFRDVQRGSEAGLQHAVATVGPISVGIDAGHSSFQLYRSGVYNERQCSTYRLDHGVLAVGYGSESGTDYWLVKNSWGTGWGERGYIKMSRNRNNQCGIATQASYPIV